MKTLALLWLVGLGLIAGAESSSAQTGPQRRAMIPVVVSPSGRETARRTDFLRRMFTPSPTDSFLLDSLVQQLHRSRLEPREAFIGELYLADPTAGHRRYLLLTRIKKDVFVDDPQRFERNYYTNDSLRLVVLAPEIGEVSLLSPSLSPYQYEDVSVMGLGRTASGEISLQYCDWSERTGPLQRRLSFSEATGWARTDPDTSHGSHCIADPREFSYGRAHAGPWWRMLSQHARYEFVVGVLECFDDDAGGRIRGGRSFDELRNRVTAAYFTGSAREETPAMEVLLGLDSSFVVPARGVHPPARRRHKRFADGLYWLNMSSEPTSDVAYVTGYLECLRRFRPDLAVAYPRRPDEYANAIGRWYWKGGQDGEMNGDRESAFVVDVLRRVAKGER